MADHMPKSGSNDCRFTFGFYHRCRGLLPQRMKYDRKLNLSSITNEINWSFLWISIARSAHSIGDFECARYAQEKANAPYRQAWELLAQTRMQNGELKLLLEDLLGLRIMLKRLNELFGADHPREAAASLLTPGSSESNR